MCGVTWESGFVSYPLMLDHGNSEHWSSLFGLKFRWTLFWVNFNAVSSKKTQENGREKKGENAAATSSRKWRRRSSRISCILKTRLKKAGNLNPFLLYSDLCFLLFLKPFKDNFNRPTMKLQNINQNCNETLFGNLKKT